MFYTPVTGFSALHKAAQRGDEEDVAALLAEGADLNARDSEGRTPLHHAVMHGHLGVVDLLLARGAPRLLLAKDILNCTPVHLAAVQNQVTLIIRLVEALLSDVEGRTPLHEVARRRCMQDFMGFLHLGWESATVDDDGSGRPLSELSPLWSVVGSVVDLKRPGLPVVQRVLGWHPLHVAAMSGNIELIRRLVQQFDCDLRVKSMNSWTPLHYAAAYNQVAVIEALISLGCEVAVQDAVGSTPMHVAAGEGHLDAIQALVRLGCSPKVTDRDGCTPLYCAAAWNRIEAVRLLEKLQCPSSLRSLEGRTPVHVAAEQGWVDLIDVLVAELGNQVDARDNYQFTPLHSAANGGHVRAIQRLVQLKHELDAKDYLGRTPLHYAALHGRVKALDELVRQGANVGERDLRGGYTALHLAADTGQCEAIARLVALGAPVDAASSKGVTPLALALMKGPANVDAICLLVELGAEVEHLTEQRGLETPMHIAARSGRLDVIERLVACPQVTVSTRTRDGSTALHYAAAFGQTHVLQALVAAGCDVDSRDSALNTPLHLAAGCGFLDTVVKLVELGADVNARDITDCTPLQNAAHGTYSALAAVPASSTAAGVANSSPATATGYAKLNPPHQPQLTPAQQAAQAALTAGNQIKKDGLVPVRTGLAWAPIASADSASAAAAGASLLSYGGAAALLGGTTGAGAGASGGLAGPGGGGAGSGGGGSRAALAPGVASAAAEAESSLIHATQDLWTTWKSLGLTQLLKKAYKQQQRRAGGSAYGGGAASSSAAAATAAAGPAAASQQASVQLQQTQQTVQAALQQMQAALQQSQVVLQQQLLLSYQQQGGASGSSSGSGAAGGGSGLGGNLTASSLAAVAGAAGPNGAVSNHEATQQWLQQYDSLGLTATITASPLTAGKGAESHVCTASTGGSASLDVLLRRSDQLCFGSGGEQDRSRLIKVVQRLVALGADLSATDNEGRTALHLAAGCGDKAMTLLLVDLGTDVNCRDSVGGTAMHHAAMANKKDMMFALARLGCDWRSRADGIDGATASFVLCGQHGKTTRQQKLLDAKLKRVFQEGAAARAAGRNPLADPASTRDDERDEEGATVDLEAEQALADAAMAALLEEVEGEADTHPGTGKATKKRRKKKKSKPGEASELLRASPEEAEDAEPAELAGPPQPSATTAAAAAAAAVTAAEGSSAAVPNGTGAAPVAAKARAASPAAAASPAVLAAQSSERSTAHLANGAVALPGSPPKQPGQPMHEQQQPSPHPQQSQAPVSVAMPGPAASLQQRQQLPGQPESHAAVAVPAGQVPPPAADAAASSVSGSGSEASEHELVRLHLEQAAEQAAKLVGGEGVGEEPSEAELAGCLQMLDEAISRAVGVGVSAKYGKKVRRKAQTVLDRLRGVVSPEPGSSSAQQQAEEGTGEAAAGAAAGGLVRQGLRAGSPAPPSPVIGGSAGMRGSVAASGAQGRLLLDQQLHQRDSGGAAAAAAAPLSFAAARQAQQQLQALSDEEMARMLQAQFDAEAAVEHSQQAQRRRGAQPGAATAPGQSAISSVLPAPSSAARTAKAEPPAAAPVPTAAQQQAGGGRAQAAPRVTVAPAPQAPLNQHAAVPAVKPQATKYVPPGVKATALVAAAPHASQAAAAKPPPPGYAPPMAAAGAASSGVQGPPVSQGKGALTGHARAQPVQLPQQPLQQSQRAASAGLGAAAGTGALPAASQLQQHAKPAAPAAPGAARAWQPPQQQQQQQQVYPLQHPLPHLVHPPASAASAMPGPPRILTPAPSVGHQQANLASTMQQQQQQQRPLSRGPASPARPPSSLASPLHQPAGSAFGSVGSLFTSAVGSSGTLFGSAAGPAEQAASHSAGLSLGSLGPNAESTSLGGVSDPGLPPTSFAGMFGASAFGPPSPGLGAPRLPTSLPPPAPSLFASSSQPPQSLQQAPAHFGAPLRATEAPSGYNVPCTRMPAAAAAAAGVGPSAAMIGQFADLDISELQQAAYDSFLSGTAGPEGLSSLIPQDLAAQVFGSDASLGGLRHSQLGAGVGRGIGPTGDFADPPSQRQQQQQQDLLDEDTSAAGTLLSSDLLGEIDGFNGGTGSVGGSGEGQPLAPRGQRQPLGAGVLSLPEDAAALFAPSQPPTSTAGLAGAQSGSFIARGSMWR